MTTRDHSRDLILPHVPKKLLEALEERFPPAPPSLDDSARMIWFKAGQRSLVDWLASVRAHQEGE